MYIAIEGADGSGKSTVAVAAYKKLLECSNQRGHIEIVSHNAFHLSSSYLARIIGHKTTKVIYYGEQKGSRVLTFAGYLLSLFPYLLAKREGKRKGIVISDRGPWITGQIYVPKVSQTAAKVIIPFAKRVMERPDYIVHLQVDSEVAWERVREKGYGQLYLSREDLGAGLILFSREELYKYGVDIRQGFPLPPSFRNMYHSLNMVIFFQDLLNWLHRNTILLSLNLL